MWSTGIAASCMPATSSASISAYQKIPLPSQLTACSSRTTGRWRAPRLTRTQRSSSQCCSRASAASRRQIKQHRLEVLHDALPGQALGGLAGFFSEAAREIGFARQPFGLGDECACIAEGGEQRARLVAQDFAR